MQLKNVYSLSLKIIVIIIILAAMLGGGIIYSASKSLTWGVEKYQEWKNEKYGSLFPDIFDMSKKSDPQEMQPIKIVDEQSQVIEVVKKASPAVVSIVASAEVPTFELVPPSIPDDFGQFFGIPQRRQNGTREQKIGAGTGFLVSSDGYIITNNHVVDEQEAEYAVYLNNGENRGEKIEARVLARDPKNDLAVLKIDKNNLPFLTFSDSEKLQVGQTVITIGYALGEFDNTVSKGVISGLSRSIVTGGGFVTPVERLKNLIQSDAAINPGNSGGPMLDIDGNVIGVNVAMANAENIGFALLGNDAKEVFQQVRDTGSIKKTENAFLGVRYMLITEAVKNNNNLPFNYGALISRGENRTDLAVTPGSPADKAGLVENDIILEVDGKKITETNQLADIIAEHNPGDEIVLRIYHKGEEKELKVVLDKN